MTPPKLSVDSEGRVHGANVTWNKTFPCVNGNPHEMDVPKGILGFILHTQVGNNPGTIETFNTPHLAKPRSAHFCVAQDGSMVQMGGVNGWKAWAQVDGNRHYYSAEFADDGDPSNPLTQAQINAGGQLLELLSRSTVGRFPMQISDRPGDEGFGWHGMGGKSWGDHPDCPGDTRKAQRHDIIKLAQAIRAGGEPPSVYTCEGHKSLHGLSQQLHNPASEILRLTAEHSPGAKFTDRMADYLNGVFAADTEKVPEGITVYHPDGTGTAAFPSHGTQTLQGLALAFNSQPSAIIRLTAEHSPGAVFSPDMAKYLNDVFSRSDTHVPSGIHLVYQK